MTSPSSTKNKDLLDRLIILEKFIELKSNECAYYRTKVHLMQMSSIGENTKRSSSEDISQNSIIIPRYRPKSSHEKTIFKKGMSNPSIPFDRSKRRYRKEIDHQISAQNQNYYENNHQNRLEQMFISYLNKHHPQSQDKNIQCNENDFHLIESSDTILKIRLPQRFVKSLLAQKKKSSTPKLKVHLSSALINKLFQTIHSNQNPFIIQSQFGKITACINHENSSKAIHAKAEMKTHHEDRLPIIRHIARTRNDGSDRRKIHHTRRKKRHFYKSSSSSHEESKRSSLTNITQTIGTFSSSSSSSNPMNNSIKFENLKNKRNKINIKR
jgi:hypothetical protein